MTPQLKSYIVLIAFLVTGILIIGVAQLIASAAGSHPAYICLALFIISGLVTAWRLGLKAELSAYWGIRKIFLMPVGILAGGLIATSPVLAGIMTGADPISGLTFSSVFTLSSFCITLVIVSWEELWFRGIHLNYCRQHLSEISLSLANGLLFMLIHLLNPSIDLLAAGPGLFFAGAFLTIIYFYFRTIWLPVGLHFGNNYLTLDSPLSGHPFFGNDGHFGTIILIALYLAFARLTLIRNKKRQA